MSAVLGLTTHRFSRAQYERMVEAGVFEPNDRLELLDGEIIDMAPQTSRHVTAVTLVGDTLRTIFGPGVTVRVQLPFSLDDHSEPEPDVAVVPGSPRDYRDAHPSRAFLVCEVADTTLAYDRGREARGLRPRRHLGVLDTRSDRRDAGGLPQARGERIYRTAGHVCECADFAPGHIRATHRSPGIAALRSSDDSSLGPSALCGSDFSPTQPPRQSRNPLSG
jgi:hypothetical protein